MDVNSLAHIKWDCKYHIGARSSLFEMRLYHPFVIDGNVMMKSVKQWDKADKWYTAQLPGMEKVNICKHCKDDEMVKVDDTPYQKVRGRGYGGFDVRYIEWTEHLRSKDGT